MGIKVRFISEVEIKTGKTALKAAKEAGIKLKDSCDGKGKCGKCIVKILDGQASEPTKEEKKLLKENELRDGFRLACQVELLEDTVIGLVND